MRKQRPELDAMLSALEAAVPTLMQDMDRFFHEFEDRSLHILGHTAPKDDAHVMAKLKAIVDRAGING